MSVVISSSLVIAETVSGGGVINANNPVIGYDNLVTESNVTAKSSAVAYPVTNVANPATYNKWQGNPAAGDDDYIIMALNTVDDIDYVGIAKHNFFTQQIPVSLEVDGGVDPNVDLLLHFTGADASTTFTDSSPSPKTFTAVGNAQIDTAQKKFGSASAQFDGSGDCIHTPDTAHLELGSGDWTLDFWVKFNDVAGGSAR